MKKRLFISVLSAGLALALALPGAMATEIETKSSCKHGAWQGLVRADGSTFGNQGACVSYAAQGGTPLVPAPLTTIQQVCEANGGTYVEDHPHEDIGQACIDSQAGADAVMSSLELCPPPVIGVARIDVDEAGCIVLS